jgi:uncharacterized protein
MSEIHKNNLRDPLISILFTLFFVVVGFHIIGPTIGAVLAYPFYPGNHIEFANALKEPFKHPEFRGSLMLMQSFATVVGTIVVPAFLLRGQRRNLTSLFQSYWYAQPVFIVAILVIVFMGVNSIVIEWNQKIEFPGDEWARSFEDLFAEGTRYLTEFNSIYDLIGVFIMIAVLPAIGEEIVFRGMIQNDLLRATKNPHIAIWVSAIVFSAFHIQFFGFFPRMLLGALFGYLYYWSGNLWIAVIAHFVNNGTQVIAMYLFKKGFINIDMEDSTSTPWQAVVFSVIFSALLLYSFKRFYNDHPKSDLPD